jgi:hypothetical protein
MRASNHPKSRLSQQLSASDINYTSFALITAMFFTAVVAATCYFLNRQVFPVNPDILSTHVSLLSLDSTEYQKRSFVYFVVVLATACVLLTKSWLHPEKLASNAHCAVFSAVALLLILLLSDWDPNNYRGFACAILLWFSLLKLAGVPGAIDVLIGFQKALTSPLVLAGLLCVLVSVLWVLPLSFPLEVNNLNDLIWVDAHYSATVLGGYDFLHSENGHRFKSLNYGIALPVLTAAYLQASQFISVSASTLPMAVKFFQLVAALLIAAIFYVRDRRNFLLGTFVVLVTVAYTLGNTGQAVKFPNQSGIRYLPLLAGILGVAFELSKNRFRIWVLSLIGGSLLASNVETGITLNVAIVAALFFQGISDSKRLFGTFTLITRFFALEVVVLSVASLILTTFVLSHPSEMFRFLSLFGVSGYGGKKTRLSLTACLVIIVAVFTLVENSYRSRTEKLCQKALWEIFVSALMLVWLTYYMNRMDEWNLWFQWVLLTLWAFSRFAADESSSGTPSLDRLSSLSFAHSIIFTLLTTMTGGQALNSILNTVKPSLKDGLKSLMRTDPTTADSSHFVSGFKLSGEFGEQVKKRLADLNRINKDEAVIFTNLPTLVRLQGFNSKAPMLSPFIGVVSYSQVPPAREAILQSGYSMLVVDRPNDSIANGDLDVSSYINLLFGTTTMNRAQDLGDWKIMPLDKSAVMPSKL